MRSQYAFRLSCRDVKDSTCSARYMCNLSNPEGKVIGFGQPPFVA